MTRSLGAAFRFERLGKPNIVQPDLSEIRAPDPGLWLFWIEKNGDARDIVLEVGGVLLERQPVVGDLEWHKTPTLRRFIRLACS